MRADITRRAFVATLPILAKAADTLPPEVKRLRDPATEFELTRLTDPAHNAWLIPPPTRSIVGRSNGLLYCSDRSGSVQAFRLEVKSGASRQLTEARNLDREGVGFLSDEKTVCYFDGPTLQTANGSRTRTLYEIESGWQRTGGFTLTDDGNHALFAERKGERSRLRMAPTSKGAVSTVFEIGEEIRFVRPRPKRAGILYGRPGSLWLVDYNGANHRKLRAAAGDPVQALWSADGRSFTYLRVPERETELNELREHTPDANEDKKIAATSQFITFSRNSDASVFAGVSRNIPSPYILLLIRLARRELTVAEHKAHDARDVTVLFTPNSQRLLWHTDREGKAAIYTLLVDQFIEATEESEDQTKG